MPELARLPERAEADMPLTAFWSGPLAEGTITPPGHMQKL